jgi:hypothetical protein
MIGKEAVLNWLAKQNGVITTQGAVVSRESYSGNDVIAKNSSKSYADLRGYLPVERWIMSTVASQSRLAYLEEGVTRIPIGNEIASLRDLAAVAEQELFGSYFTKWPLAKILDVGGVPIESSFGSVEVPPGAVEVHRGVFIDGKMKGPGKLEAYFYPPSVISRSDATLRIGFKSGVTKEDVREALLKFGVDDSMYALLREYPVLPMTGWTVPEGVMHSTAAYVTFEIQVPQDGYNAATWKFGQRLEGVERSKAYREKVLKGLPDEHAYIEQLIDWELSTDDGFKEKYGRVPKVLEEGVWGRRYQIFYDAFYGEGWEILPGQSFRLDAFAAPRAGVLWSGAGTINGHVLSSEGKNEFLVVPKTEVVVNNTGNTALVLYVFEPLR